MARQERKLSGPPTSSSARALIEGARACLDEAATATTPANRFAAAHLAALRAAAAMLAARAQPAQGRHRPRSVWELLPRVAPTLAEWAAYFAAGAAKRAAAEAGLTRAVTERDADDLLRDAKIFLEVVQTTLGLPDQVAFPISILRAS